MLLAVNQFPTVDASTRVLLKLTTYKVVAAPPSNNEHLG